MGLNIRNGPITGPVLYTIPRAQRAAFFSGRGLPTAAASGRRQQQPVVTTAVVAPPKKGKELPPFEAWNTGAVVKKRTDIKTILILGPGPIIIGQVRACTVGPVRT